MVEVAPPKTHRKRGGPQPGSGAPKKPPEEKFRRAQITMTPEHYDATAKDRSGMVRRALELYLTPRNSNETVSVSREGNENLFFKHMERYEASFICNECGVFGQERFSYQRSVANGEVWICDECRSEVITPNKPNEDNY